LPEVAGLDVGVNLLPPAVDVLADLGHRVLNCAAIHVRRDPGGVVEPALRQIIANRLAAALDVLAHLFHRVGYGSADCGCATEMNIQHDDQMRSSRI